MLASKVHGILDEMGVAYTKLVMPTQNNLNQLKGVFEACEALVETKRAVDRVDQEIRTLKSRLRERRAKNGTTSQDDMDIDGVDGEMRAQSESQFSQAQRNEADEESQLEQDQDANQSEGDLDRQESDDEMQDNVVNGQIDEDGEQDQEEDGEQEEDDGASGQGLDDGGDGGSMTELEDEDEEVNEAEEEEDDNEEKAGDEDDGDWDENVSEVPSIRSKGRVRIHWVAVGFTAKISPQKRALSNSSMETSGTTMTRRSSKRQRSQN